MSDVNSQMPVPASQPIGSMTDARSGRDAPITITQPWYRFFLALYQRTGGASGSASVILDQISTTRGSLLGRFGIGWAGFSPSPGQTNRIPITSFNQDPTLKSLSQLIDDAISNLQGSILYRSALGWVSLPPGINGQILALTAGEPDWVNSAAAIATVATGLTGAGTNQGNALLLPAQWNQFSTVAGGTGAIVDAASPIGGDIVVTNRGGANNLNVYPTVGGQINALGLNNPIVLAVTSTLVLRKFTANQWYT